jgi:hypothetical protein
MLQVAGAHISEANISVALSIKQHGSGSLHSSTHQ